MPALDIEANRSTPRYSRGENLRRVLWWGGRLLFHASPRPCFRWRRFLLRLYGARVGRAVHVYNSARIAMPWNLEVGDWSSIGEEARIYNLGPVRLGERVTVSQGAHLCAGTHDYTRADMPLLRPPIEIGDDAWICADAFVGPGVRVGPGAVVGARAVATKDVEPWTVVGGNPAQVLKKRKLEPS